MQSMTSGGGCMYTNTIEHEFLHAIGLFHTPVLLGIGHNLNF